MKYVKNPIEVDAIQYRKTFDSFYDLSKWIESFDQSVFDNFRLDNNFKLTIITLEGRMLVSEGDYIIRGIEGEFYACKESIFLKTYSKAE